MRRQGQYSDSGAHSYAAQMQQISAQRMQHGSGTNHFSGRPDALPSDEDRPYGSSKVEGQWQWELDGPKGLKPMSPHIFNEGQGGDVSRSFYKSQRQDSKMSTEKQSSKDPRAQLHEQDMEIGFEDNPLVQTFEGIEQKFHDEIMKLAKEQYDAEDAENARHREKVNEVNTIYQEKLASLRVQHASRRDEFLRRESQARQHQYQQAGATQYQNPNAGTRDPHPQGYGGSTEAAGEAPRRGFASGQLDSYRERAQYLEGASRNSQGSTRNNHGYESSRGPYPGGRVYNNNNNSRFY